MKKLARQAWVLPAGLALLLCGSACNNGKDENQANKGMDGATPGPGMMGGPRGKPSPIAKIMIKLAKGPQSLTPMIGAELKKDSPSWDPIQPQTTEFALLAASLAKHDPPKGSKESWQKLTAAYADSAASLDRAAQAKDRAAALVSYKALAGSCMACHREHRVMGGPGMGEGRPGGFDPRRQVK